VDGVGMFCGDLVYLRPFDIFFPVWYVVTKKNWQPWTTRATLVPFFGTDIFNNI
jgi:hypothetical protein